MALFRSLVIFLVLCVGSFIFFAPWEASPQLWSSSSELGGFDTITQPPLPPAPPLDAGRQNLAPVITPFTPTPGPYPAHQDNSEQQQFQQSDRKINQVEAIEGDNGASSIVQFLQRNSYSTTRTLFFSFGEEQDVPRLQNFPFQLARGGRKDDFIVMCLDAGCMAAPGFVKYNAVGKELGEVKITAQLALSKASYNFIFMDASIVLTGTLDPFAFMLGLDDTAWDIQFLPDSQGRASGVSPGWFWAKSNPATIKFFQACETRWRESKEGGIWQILNTVGKNLQNSRELKIKLLPWQYFKVWYHYMDWEVANITSNDAMDELLASTVLIYLTCVDRPLQLHLTKLLSGYGDINGYYTNPPKFMAISNLNGNARDIPLALTLIAMVARDIQRTLIFPEYVTLTQVYDGGERRIDRFPTYRLIDPNTLIVPHVEGRYLYNRKRYTPEKLTEETLSMQFAVRRFYASFSETQVVTIDLDMGGSEWRSIENLPKMMNPTKNTMRLCANPNEETFKCDARCV